MNGVWRNFDAGVAEARRDPNKQDCQVRALTTALGIPYSEAWAMLYIAQGERRACGFTLVNELRDKKPAFGVIRQLDFPAVRGKARMTGQEFVKKHKQGRFILRLAHHVVAVKDGQLFDTWDSSHGCVYTAWEIQPR